MYLNVKETAEKWKISERSVRNYCSQGKIPGAIIDGKSWKIPKNAVKPVRKKRNAMIPRDLPVLLLKKNPEFPVEYTIKFKLI